LLNLFQLLPWFTLFYFTSFFNASSQSTTYLDHTFAICDLTPIGWFRATALPILNEIHGVE
jgi:hypothetical protein